LVCKVITADAGGYICLGLRLLEQLPDAAETEIPRERRTPMLPRDRIVEGVRELLEQQYFNSAGDRSKDEYGGLNDGEQRAALKAFLKKITAGSESHQWARVLQDIVQSDPPPTLLLLNSENVG
jgi:hypothetical protein